jgi:hypothetical protein
VASVILGFRARKEAKIEDGAFHAVVSWSVDVRASRAQDGAANGTSYTAGRRMVLTDSADPLGYLALVVLIGIGGLALVAAAWWARDR